MHKPTDLNDYIGSFPSETQKLLWQMREYILNAAPQSEEVISYGMPAFKWNGILVWFAGYDKHIGFYPSSSGIAAFKEELSSYKNSKGAVQFPLDQPLPAELITRIVEFRIAENLKKAEIKKLVKQNARKSA